MIMLNNNMWEDTTGTEINCEGMWSYTRIFEDKTHYSIIDCCFVDKNILPHISKFIVGSLLDNIIDSDHAPMMMDIRIRDRTVNHTEEVPTIYGYKTNWSKFKSEVNVRMKKFKDERTSVQYRSSFLTESMLKSYNSTSVRYKQKIKQEKC